MCPSYSNAPLLVTGGRFGVLVSCDQEAAGRHFLAPKLFYENGKNTPKVLSLVTPLWYAWYIPTNKKGTHYAV